MTTSNEDFINIVKEECRDNGISCYLRKGKYVKMSDNVKCGGWFDEDKKELVVAMGHIDSMGILVHEYSHMHQSIENIPIWKPSLEGCDKMDKWLSGKTVRNIDFYIDAVKYMELDNEKRSAKIIKKLGLDIDLDMYIKKANAYIHFYNWIKKTRRWSTPKNSPYKNPNLLSVMSTKFNMDYDTLPKKVEQVFKDENI